MIRNLTETAKRLIIEREFVKFVKFLMFVKFFFYIIDIADN